MSRCCGSPEWARFVVDGVLVVKECRSCGATVAAFDAVLAEWHRPGATLKTLVEVADDFGVRLNLLFGESPGQPLVGCLPPLGG